MNQQELDEFLARKNYQIEIADELKKFGISVEIEPINFPKTVKVNGKIMDAETALKTLKRWVVSEHNAKVANERVDYFRKKFNNG